ncbi:sigma-70 family RNA polymerase sigma factor [Cyanobium sp. CH-040]|uniref:sigma-70 family RNA polymerase sigma factor n=1 Tax=Cyanobium sp. CH-040 TaxID=2823708 RepID=UPI0020CDF90F|nr:sigma-70 family RNA polymerase sigma factor [Cyanobium sp. CH-040]MCP9926972.1 sigma-70 family RNA polymerase sigma factor [Cyanobium sp. CH-040]
MSTVTARPGRCCRPAQPRCIARRNERIEAYRELVRPIALHYHQRCAEPLDDLTQVGLLGLLRAAELYRPGSGTPFAAFARPHVRGAILHYLRDLAAPVRLPRRLEERRHQLRCLRREWTARHGTEPTAAQLRGALGLSPRQWQDLEATADLQRPLSLEEGMADEAQGRASASATGSGEPDERAQQLLALLGSLEEPLRTVVERVVLTGWSYRRTAEALKVSPMTVQRRLRRGLEQLRGLLSCPAAGAGRAASAAPGC